MTKRVAAATSAEPTKKARPLTVRSLRASLDEAEQALAAIRTGEVDVLVMGGPGGARVFTLEGADHGYRVLLEVMSEGVAKLNAHGIIGYCNARFAAILDLPLESTIGSSVHELVAPSERGRFEALLAAGAHERSEGEFRLAGPGVFARVPVLLSVVPLTTGDAEVQCLVMTDLTEQRRVGEAMAAERTAMQARLLVAERMSSMGAVAAGVAHEINNPLAYVVASLELMLSELPELSGLSDNAEWMRRQLNRAHEGVARVCVIVRDLKAFSRADDESMSVVDLRRVLDASLALVANEIRLRARLVRDFDTVVNIPGVRANAARLQQVFVHLLVNATQAIPQGASDRHEIRVSARADGEGHAVVEIRDTGAGIAPENLTRIFEPFFTTKAVGIGTGLGLALCHGIVASFGGQITVESEPGAGALFRVVLPAVANDALAAPPADPRGRMLIVDDEREFVEILQESLSRFHEVVTTTDAREAIEWIARGERFDMILCDMRMPKMTGLDFYASLVTTNPAQAARVVLMSGGFTRQPSDAPLALPTPILEKPFTTEQVRTHMRDAMARGPRPVRAL